MILIDSKTQIKLLKLKVVLYFSSVSGIYYIIILQDFGWPLICQWKSIYESVFAKVSLDFNMFANSLMNIRK